MARDHKAGGQSEPHAARMGELLPSRNRQQGVSGARCLRGDAVAPVVALQAQSQATKGRELSTLAPLRALRARTSEPAWARRVVDEGVRSCPRAGCGRSARPVVCPAKAGMFSRRKTCRGRVRSPVVWIAGLVAWAAFSASRVLLVFGRPIARSFRISLAHVSALLRVPVIVRAGEMIDARVRVHPDDRYPTGSDISPVARTRTVRRR